MSDEKQSAKRKRHEGFSQIRKKTPPPGRAMPSKKEKEKSKRPKHGELMKEAEGEDT